jgi:flavodoxin
MRAPNILIVYYSRTGTTRGVAHMLAEQLGCALEEIVDRTPRAGLVGWLRSGFDATFARVTTLGERREDPAAYDLVLIGTPVWNRSVSTPVRSYLQQNCMRLPEVAFFLTHGGIARNRVFGQMTKLAGREPVARLSVTEAEFDRGEYFGKLKDFANQLRASASKTAQRNAAQPAAAALRAPGEA